VGVGRDSSKSLMAGAPAMGIIVYKSTAISQPGIKDAGECRGCARERLSPWCAASSPTSSYG
jgi:hypothetical protein